MRANLEQAESLLATNPKRALLSGPRGVGKMFTATKIASALGGFSLALQDPAPEELRAVTPDQSVLVEFTGTPNSTSLSLLRTLDVAKLWVVVEREPRQLSGCFFRFRFSAIGPEELASLLREKKSSAADDPHALRSGSVEMAVEVVRSKHLAASVSSWIEAVNAGNRGLLLTCTDGWGRGNSDLLASEIEMQAAGKSVINGVRITAQGIDRTSIMCRVLRGAKQPRLSAMALGLQAMKR